jgi:hypothetical protein
MSLREAAQQALEALEDIFGKNKIDVGAITALRAALSDATCQESRQVEPAAWMWDYRQLDGHIITKVIFAKHYSHSPGDLAYILDGQNATPLYLDPPKRKPLTDDEIHDCFQQKHRDKVIERRLITRAIEAANGIKGNA